MFKGSPAHVGTPFEARAPARYPASYPGPTTWRSGHIRSGFPVGFRPPAFASWASCSRQRFPLSSRSAYSLSFTRPAFPSPVDPGWNRNASAFPWASHPAVTHDARQGGNGPSDTGPDHVLVNRPPTGVTTHYVRHHVARLPSASPFLL